MEAEKKHGVFAHARADVIASRWVHEECVGYMTFRCRTCKYQWEWKALYEQQPLKGKPYGAMAVRFYSRYWDEAHGGVKVKCPSCGAGGDERK